MEIQRTAPPPLKKKKTAENKTHKGPLVRALGFICVVIGTFVIFSLQGCMGFSRDPGVQRSIERADRL